MPRSTTSMTITMTARDLDVPEFCLFFQEETSCFWRREEVPAPFLAGGFAVNTVFCAVLPDRPDVPGDLCI